MSISSGLSSGLALLRNRLHKPAFPVDETARTASYPEPYPDGWYKVADSADLKPGDVKSVSALGQRWVVFRSDDGDHAGQVGILDATCPHQGANLAAGTVKDGCLECPFHKWRFATDGQTTAVPYAVKFPPSLRARSWPATELHGMVLVYYSADRADGGDAEPPYRLDPIERLRGMVYRGAHDHPRPVRMHLIEFAENSADFQHFQPLHGRMHIPWTSSTVPLVNVIHSPTWEIDPTRPHISYFHNDPILEVAGRKLANSGARATITFLGPGGVTVFQIQLPKVGAIILFHTHLPNKPLEQTVQFRWYADAAVPRVLVSYVVGSWIAQWRTDIAIWENTYYNDRPMLLPNDGPVLRMRRWFKQFYPARSQKLAVLPSVSAIPEVV